MFTRDRGIGRALLYNRGGSNYPALAQAGLSSAARTLSSMDKRKTATTKTKQGSSTGREIYQGLSAVKAGTDIYDSVFTKEIPKDVPIIQEAAKTPVDVSGVAQPSGEALSQSTGNMALPAEAETSGAVDTALKGGEEGLFDGMSMSLGEAAGKVVGGAVEVAGKGVGTGIELLGSGIGEGLSAVGLEGVGGAITGGAEAVGAGIAAGAEAVGSGVEFLLALLL